MSHAFKSRSVSSIFFHPAFGFGFCKALQTCLFWLFYFIGSVIHFWKLMFSRHESYLVCNCNLRKVFESYLLMIRVGKKKLFSDICSTRFDTLIVFTALHEIIFCTVQIFIDESYLKLNLEKYLYIKWNSLNSFYF